MSDQPLLVTLTVPQGPQPAGAFIPVTVEVRNVSAHPVWTVGVLEGSEWGLRYPHYAPHISGPEAQPPQPLECGVMTPLRAADFRLLEPGMGFDPTRSVGGAAYVPLAAFNNFIPTVPGRYELWLTLSTRSKKDEEWRVSRDSAEGEMALSLLAETHRLEIKSNVATVEVR